MDEILEKKFTKKNSPKKFHQCEQNHVQCENRLKVTRKKIKKAMMFYLG
jgi:hypothetical protein